MILRRKPKEPEMFWLEKLIPGTAKWQRVTEYVGEEPRFGECQEFFIPGGIYRLLARNIETGRIRSVWRHVHREPDYSSIKFL